MGFPFSDNSPLISTIKSVDLVVLWHERSSVGVGNKGLGVGVGVAVGDGVDVGLEEGVGLGVGEITDANTFILVMTLVCESSIAKK
jgi:hypothetical protein